MAIGMQEAIKQMLAQGTGIMSRAGLAGLGKSAAIGVAEGAGGALLADTVAFPMANRWGADLGWEDLAADMNAKTFEAVRAVLESHRPASSAFTPEHVADLEGMLQ